MVTLLNGLLVKNGDSLFYSGIDRTDARLPILGRNRFSVFGSLMAYRPSAYMGISGGGREKPWSPQTRPPPPGGAKRQDQRD